MITSPLPKIPLDVSIRGKQTNFPRRKYDVIILSLAHWLAIDGQQPLTCENPEIVSKDELAMDSLDPVSSTKIYRFIEGNSSSRQKPW